MNPTNGASSLNTLHIEEVSGPWIEVDLDAVDHNIQAIRRWCRSRMMPVIKANAYGLGLVPIARRLAGSPGVEGLCVGAVREAVALGEAGLTIPVLNLGAFTPGEAERIVALGIAQSVSSDAVKVLDRIAAAQGRTADVHVKIDTGLGRIGVHYTQASDFIDAVVRLGNVRIAGVFTTLSEDPEFDRIQIERFTAALAGPAGRGVSLGLRHAASSAAILASPDAALDMVRPGIMVTGCYPSAEERNRRRIDLKPALSLKTRVSCIKELKAGDPVGYHRAYRAPGDERLVIGAIGYADGYPVQLAGRAKCLIGGFRHPVVASVTANHICVRSRGGEIRPGDEIVLYGRQKDGFIDIEDIAAQTEHSVYNLLARLNPDLPRFYRG
ncbi:MAG: alanine racemase [Desulfobacterales bacterium]